MITWPARHAVLHKQAQAQQAEILARPAKPKTRAQKLKAQTVKREPEKVAALRDAVRAISELTGTQHHLDHKDSVANGGGDDISNLRIITAEENLRKGAKSC